MKVAFICNNIGNINRVYGQGRKEKIAEKWDLVPEIITAANFDAHKEELKDVEVAFSTWGMPTLTDEQLDCMPKLKVLMYAAGSVKAFAPIMMKRGIKVISGWGANAQPVSEFAVSQILLSNKGYFRNIRLYHSPETYQSPETSTDPNAIIARGNYGETVAILGAGQVGRAVLAKLRNYKLNVLLYDPYVDEAEAAELGAKKVTLEEAFAQANVVSNHMPDLPEIRGIITGKLLSTLRPGATFINCGRGAEVVEADLIEVLTARPDLTALLDVTMPEPPVAGSPFYTLKNVFLTSHIAGALGDEVLRMSDCMIEQAEALEAGREMNFVVDPEKLSIMA